MVKIQLELDRLTSMLASYHILCAPTSINKQYNPAVFSNLIVTPEERGHYLTYLLSKGVTLDRTDSVRTSFFFPESRTLDDFFETYGKEVPDEVKNNLKSFETRFDSYLEKVRANVGPLIQSRSRESQEMIGTIYNLAQEFTGVSIERPEELEVRIVEGLAPSSRGSEVRNGRGYIVEQTRNFLSTGDSYLLTLIHEAVAHQTADDSRKYMQETFGGYVYDVEEGFAKLFSRKIAERILGREVNYGTEDGLQRLAYDTFNRNWGSLNGTNFGSWYDRCLTEIKNTCQK